jgi:hypothetical protein
MNLCFRELRLYVDRVLPKDCVFMLWCVSIGMTVPLLERCFSQVSLCKLLSVCFQFALEAVDCVTLVRCWYSSFVQILHFHFVLTLALNM